MAIEPGETGIALQQSAVSDGARLRSSTAEAGSRDIEQIGVERLQRIGAEAEPVHDARREILDDNIGTNCERPRNRDRFRLFQVEDDASFRLTKHDVQLGGTSW